MRKYDHPYYADWFAISLRWLVLIGVAYSLVLADVFNYFLAGTVLAGVFWNFSVSILAIFNRRLPLHRVVNVFFDFIGTTCLFYFSDGFFGPLSWIGLLSLFSSGIYFSWRGGILLAVLVTATQIGGSVLIFDLDVSTRAMLLLAGFNLLSGLLFGMLSQQLYLQLRSHYQAQRREREQSDTNIKLAEKQRMQEFYDLIQALSESLDYQTVVRTALDLSIKVLEANSQAVSEMLSAILMFKGDQLIIVDARGFPSADRRTSFGFQSGVLARVVQSPDPVLLVDPAGDPELGKLLVVRDCSSALFLPLNRGHDSIGVMLFAHPQEDFFTQDLQDLLEVLNHHVVIAIQNALLFREVETEKNHLAKAQEEERKSLARELHDGPTQSITAIAMRAEYIRQGLGELIEKNSLAGELQQIEELARKTTQEIRQMLYSLRPLVLEKKGLANALTALGERMEEVFRQKVVIALDQKAIDKLDEVKQTVIFQIVDEALNNARKHANASLIHVRLNFSPDTDNAVLLEVQDNGEGFDYPMVRESYAGRGSLGLVNLSERADLIDGKIHIESAPGKGTLVQVAIPLTDGASEQSR